ncbi:MAG: putative metal-binding motif-containing protein [Myxococcales bacterium]|nr:putative metal-binding motif-containing protein [Myxococcales bacterium]
MTVTRHTKSSLAVALASALVAACGRPQAGYVEVVVDTDIPRQFAVTLVVRVVALDDPSASLRDAGRDGEAGRPDAGASDDASGARDAGVMDARATDGSTAGGDASDAGDPLAMLDVLEIDPGVRSFTWTRQSDGGVSLPASFSVVPIAGRDGVPMLVEVDIATQGDSTAANPPQRWRQYAIVRPRAGEQSVVRMFLTRRCNAPVRGCSNLPDRRCSVDAYCADRGLTCGDDGQCVAATALPTWAARAVPERCAPGSCGPRCAPCGAGNTCSSDGRCVRTDARATPCLDGDGDGFGVGPACFGVDCDDGDRLNFGGNVEYCDGRDNDCDRDIDEEQACDQESGRSCANARSVDLVTATTATINVDTRWGGTLLEPSCRFSGHEGGTGRERWFRVEYPANQELDARAVTSLAHGTDTVLLAFESCARGSLVACNDDVIEQGNSGSRVVVHPSPGAMGTRTLLFAVDSWSINTEGPLRFEVTRRDPSSPLTCDGAFDASMGGTFAGVLGAAGAVGLWCSPDGVNASASYRIAPTARRYAAQASVPDRTQSVSLGGDFGCALSASTACVSSERVREEDVNYLVADPGFDGVVFVEGARGTPYMLNVSGSLFSY